MIVWISIQCTIFLSDCIIEKSPRFFIWSFNSNIWINRFTQQINIWIWEFLFWGISIYSKIYCEQKLFALPGHHFYLPYSVFLSDSLHYKFNKPQFRWAYWSILNIFFIKFNSPWNYLSVNHTFFTSKLWNKFITLTGRISFLKTSSVTAPDKKWRITKESYYPITQKRTIVQKLNLAYYWHPSTIKSFKTNLNSSDG
jgi:hypothetical protein